MNARVVKLKTNETNQAAEVLSLAFSTDPLMLWVFGSPAAYQAYSKAVFKTWISYCLLYGEVYRTEDFNSVAILKSPGNTDFSLWGIIRSGMYFNLWSLGKEGWNRLLKYDAIATEHAKSNMTTKYLYLWMLGTNPESQGKGLGTALLNEIDQQLNASEEISCYLDATSESSTQLYTKNGYKKMTFFRIPDTNIEVTCMSKASNTTGKIVPGI